MPNINDFDRLYRRTKIGVGVTNGTVRLALNPIKPHTFRVLTHVTVEDVDHDVDILRIGIHSVGRDHFLDEILAVDAAELCVSRSDILLGEGDIFFAEFTGTTNGNQLKMTCIGWEQHLKGK